MNSSNSILYFFESPNLMIISSQNIFQQLRTKQKKFVILLPFCLRQGCFEESSLK